jgi:trehalose/maltose hydrolase-like predicted phosphorylase
VTLDCCPSGRLYELHITGDIAFAARQYFSATSDKDGLLNGFGGELIYQTAQFWSSRAIYNNTKKQYEILSQSFLFDLKKLLHFVFDSCFTTG